MNIFNRYSKEIIIVFLILLNFYIWQIIYSGNNAKFTVYFLDIGQGDSILIKSPSGNKMLIDSGSNRKILEELSEVLPFSDKNIEVIISTHPDKDHIGGTLDVLKRYKTEFVIDSNVSAQTRIFTDLETFILNENIKRIIAQRGMVINLGGGVKFLILFPDRDVSSLDPNDASIIGKLTFREKSFLLTGDSSKKIEEYLTSLDKNLLESDVLKVGHHGSKTSSSETFINTVKPKYAVIQAGRDNSYGHPHEEVIKVLEDQNIEILGNYDLGTIIFESDGFNLNVSYEK